MSATEKDAALLAAWNARYCADDDDAVHPMFVTAFDAGWNAAIASAHADPAPAKPRHTINGMPCYSLAELGLTAADTEGGAHD